MRLIPQSYDGTQDSHMLDLFSDSVPTAVPKRQDALGGSIVKSLVLLHRACRLFDRPDEPTISLDDIQPLSARSSISVSPDHEGRPGPPQTPSGGPSPQSSTTTSASLCFAPYDWSTVDVPPSYTFPPEVVEFERTMDCFVAHIPQAYRDPARKVAGGVVPWDQEVSGPHDLGNWDLERPAQGGEISGINPVVILLRESSPQGPGFCEVGLTHETDLFCRTDTQLYTCFVFLHEEQCTSFSCVTGRAKRLTKVFLGFETLISTLRPVVLDQGGRRCQVDGQPHPTHRERRLCVSLFPLPPTAALSLLLVWDVASRPSTPCRPTG